MAYFRVSMSPADDLVAERKYTCHWVTGTTYPSQIK